MSSDAVVVLREEDWRRRQAEHTARVRPWVEPRQARTRAGEKHPVDDFLFEYYPYSVAKLSAWHPGLGVVLAGDATGFLQWPVYVETSDGVTADLTRATFRPDRLDLAIRILEGTSHREPMTGCFGLHEWAMVYGLPQDQIRHEQVPLRVSPDTVRATVDEVGLRCTHIDAFRFFTPEAIPLNAVAPTRAAQPDLEQPGCLHASMDLYKYAMWFSPFVGSDLVADCFEQARRARALDMRASPYDVSSFGLEPVPVETPEGRRTYADQQRALMVATQPLRRRLLAALSSLSAAGGRMPA